MNIELFQHATEAAIVAATSYTAFCVALACVAVAIFTLARS